MASRVAASSPSSRWLAGPEAPPTGSHARRWPPSVQPLLATIHRAGPGNLAAAGRLGDAAVDGQLLQVQAEQPVIGGQHRQTQLFGHAGADPLIPAAAQGTRRAGGIGDPAITAAEHQDLDELVENDAVRGFQDGRWQGRHESSV
jgi:hypothetical protein